MTDTIDVDDLIEANVRECAHLTRAFLRDVQRTEPAVTDAVIEAIVHAIANQAGVMALAALSPFSETVH